MATKTSFTKSEIKTWFEPEKINETDLLLPQIPLQKQSRILNYLNSILIHQVDFILDTISENGLDFYENQVIRKAIKEREHES